MKALTDLPTRTVCLTVRPVCDICRLADSISCYLYEYILYIPIPIPIPIPTCIPIRSASLADRSSSLANPSASLQVCSLHLSHTAVRLTVWDANSRSRYNNSR